MRNEDRIIYESNSRKASNENNENSYMRVMMTEVSIVRPITAEVVDNIQCNSNHSAINCTD